jgi:hypothetical protein
MRIRQAARAHADPFPCGMAFPAKALARHERAA